MYKCETIIDISHAERKLQFAREIVLRGFVKESLEILTEIGAFYERARLKGRAKACDNTLTKILNISDYHLDYYSVLDELNNLVLGPMEQMGANTEVG